jgi:dihydrofolate reductase
MRRVIVSEYVTLDGVIEDPGGAESFELGGWSRPYFSPDAGKFAFEQLFSAEALLLGRVTYEGFAAAWPAMKDEQGFADRMNTLPKYVVSRTLRNAAWNRSIVLRGDAAAEVGRIKQQDGGPLLVYGSARLVRTLLAHDLVDELRLWIHPVVLGAGKRLFADRDNRNLRLIASQELGSGVVIVTYRPLTASA